jgi:DNA polymerase III delta prime subunit
MAASTTKVVLLSGPPGCGKDTSASFLVNAFVGAVHREFKGCLHTLTCAHYKVDDPTWKRLCLRENKEVPQPELGGISPRAAMIHMSEVVIKPTHGNDYFAVCTADSLVSGKLNVVSDCGFQEEIGVMVDRLGAANVLVIRIHRAGHTFAGDSRAYVYTDKCAAVDLPNDATTDELGMSLLATVAPWITPGYVS